MGSTRTHICSLSPGRQKSAKLHPRLDGARPARINGIREHHSRLSKFTLLHRCLGHCQVLLARNPLRLIFSQRVGLILWLIILFDGGVSRLRHHEDSHFIAAGDGDEQVRQ